MSRGRTSITIPGLDVPKAKRYSRVRLAVLAGSTAWSLAQLGWFASGRRSARLKQTIERGSPDPRMTAPAYAASVMALSWLANLPVAFAGGHLVERRFGLTNQSHSGWLADQVKGLAVGLVIQPPLLALTYAVIRRRPRDWWLILATAALPFTVVLSNLAPVLLMPIFNRFTPLRDREMASRIQALVARSGVAISDVYEMDMSRQSEKPNAMFTGIGNTKRIVLSDTLLERFDADEIDAVVAHELGHQVHGDMWRLIGFGTAVGFGISWLAYRLGPPLVSRISTQTGVTEIGDEASMPVLAALLTGIGLIVMPLQAAFSRAIERRTDRYAIELIGDGDAYARAMERLATQSLADPDPPAPVVFMLYTHPPIAERIAAARAWEEAKGQGGSEATPASIRG